MTATTAPQTTSEVFTLELSSEELDVLLRTMAIVNSVPSEATVMESRTVIDLGSVAPKSLSSGPFAMPAAA